MKIFVSDKAMKRIMEMIKSNKAGNIQIRKYNINKDPATNVINKIKLSDEHRKKHRTGRFYTYYISKEKLIDIRKQLGSEVEREGGFFPALLALLPAILSGIGAAGAVAGGASAIAKAVNDKKASDLQLEEQQRHNREVETIAKGGSGIEVQGEGKRVYNSFVKALNLDKDSRKAIKSILEALQSVVRVEKHGEALYLYPPS
jgi:hypothetical protein